MDTFTHIAIGTCLGEAFLGRQVGRPALLIGAVAQIIPDIDVFAQLWMGTTEGLLAHRGFTHSLLCSAFLSFLFAWMARSYYRSKDISWIRWLSFLSVSIFGHIFLDGLNIYGTGWYEPFSHQRVALNLLYVADPFFTLIPGIACVLLFSYRKFLRLNRFLALAGLTWCLVYINYSLYNKSVVAEDVNRLASQRGINVSEVYLAPTELNVWLWYLVIREGENFYIGYRSVFDTEEDLHLHRIPQQKHLLEPYPDDEDVIRLERFSQGWYTIENRGDSLLFNDLRFGRINGWRHPEAASAFQFYLSHRDQNDLIVQRGRYQGWNDGAFEALVQRIRGK